MSQHTETLLSPLHTEHELAEITLLVALDRNIDLERKRYHELIKDMLQLSELGMEDSGAYNVLLDLVGASIRRTVRCRDLRDEVAKTSQLDPGAPPREEKAA